MSSKDCVSPLRGCSPFMPASRLSYGLVCFGLILLARPFVLEADTNVAQGKPATQSSTLPGYPTAVAASAVDGNTSGNWADGSVTATNLDTNAWWQVDLGSSATVNSVVVWNRTDCCASRLSDYWVFVSNTPFLATDTPATLASRPASMSCLSRVSRSDWSLDTERCPAYSLGRR